jgi:iron complex transport system ATP-binding protein
MTALLTATGLRYRHPKALNDAVAGVSLRVDAGEVVGIIGPNAAGKSTVARLCCGLLESSAGEVKLQGEPLAKLSRRERARRVAFLQQDPPSDLAFTAREVALMGRAPHLGLWAMESEADLARAIAALAEASALQLADRPISQLSGGERQRVFLARAFAQDAKLLILDEPTDGLDLAHQVTLVDALRARAKQGAGSLLVLHDLALAGAACDRLILLDKGTVHAEGTPAQVLEAGLLGATYGALVDVVQDPRTGLPLVTPRITRERA